MTIPILINSDSVSLASCSQDVSRRSKCVSASMRSPLQGVAGKSTIFAIAVISENGSYLWKRRQEASSSSGSTALSTSRCAHSLVNMFEKRDTVQLPDIDGRCVVSVRLEVFVDFCQCSAKESS